jgi:hypothetical protein
MSSLERGNLSTGGKLPWEFCYPKIAGEMAEKYKTSVDVVVSSAVDFYWNYEDFFSSPEAALVVFWLLDLWGRDPGRTF